MKTRLLPEFEATVTCRESYNCRLSFCPGKTSAFGAVAAGAASFFTSSRRACPSQTSIKTDCASHMAEMAPEPTYMAFTPWFTRNGEGKVEWPEHKEAD